MGDHWEFERHIDSVEYGDYFIIPVIVTNDTEESITRASAAELEGEIDGDPYAISSNEVEVLIPVKKEREPIVPPKPPVPVKEVKDVVSIKK